MRADANCPDPGVLSQFLCGLLEPAPFDSVEQHLQGCPRCQSLIETLEPEDDLVTAMRGQSPIAAVAEHPAVRALLARNARPGSGASLQIGADVGPVEPDAALGPDGLVGAGAYAILFRLGSGGMGDVYLARQKRPNRLVALKLCRPARSGGAERSARFRAEVEIAAGLRHPHIVDVYETGDINGCPFFTMEYVEGGSLAGRLAEGPLSPAETAKLVATLAGAVHSAHQRGVVHRDLKPSNVLLTADGTPKIADFGLAKAVAAGGDWPGLDFSTETGATLGTPSYMAPEQALGREAGPAADVYALGAILYECLTGRPPFKGATHLETLDQVRQRDPVPPSALRPGLARDLETICLKCLRKEPARRYASAKALADDLGRFVRGEPVEARPVGRLERAWKWARRRPTAAALAASSVLALFGLAAVVALYTNRLRAEARRAEAGEKLAAAHYRCARETLRRMIERVQGDRFAAVPRLKELRQELLQDALAFYESVLARPEESDPEVRLDAALAYTDVGMINSLLGRPGVPEHLNAALAILEGLPPGVRDSTEAGAARAHCYGYLSNVAMQAGRTDEAIELCRQFVAECRGLANQNPHDAHWQDGVARAENTLGSIYLALGRAAEAEPYLRRAVAVRAEVLARDPADDRFRAEQGETLLNLAHALAGLDRPNEAEPMFREAEGLLEPVARQRPLSDHAISLGGLYVNWGNLTRRRGDDRTALARYDRAVTTLEAVLRVEPEYTMARTNALMAHGARAQLRESTGDLAGAARDWDRVVELADDRARPDYRLSRALAWARAGDHLRAAAEAGALGADPASVPKILYNLACLYALLDEPAARDARLPAAAGWLLREHYARTAVGLLTRLEPTDFFRRPEYRELLRTDTDLRSLRGRPDFQALARRLAPGPAR